MVYPIRGFAGSVRMMTLKSSELKKAEKHGKRLDASSQSRKINDLDPISTTGLDLTKLYEKHIAQADKVRKGDIKALHLIVQFPKYLVGDKSNEWKLEQARAYAARVFGDMAVFADRLDVDEKNQDVVDVFVAPLYRKKTKHTSQIAFTTTKHLTALAKEHGKSQTAQGKGQAMQDELFQFFKEIGLERAERGAKKERPGPDWKASEELRAIELDEVKARQKIQENVLEIMEQRLRADEEDLAAQTGRFEKDLMSLKEREARAAECEAGLQAREAAVGRRDQAYSKRLAELEATNKLIEQGYLEMENDRQSLIVQIEQEKQAVRAAAQDEIDNKISAANAEIQDKTRKSDECIEREYDALRSAKQSFAEDAKRKKEAEERYIAEKKDALDQREQEIVNQDNMLRIAHRSREHELNAREQAVNESEATMQGRGEEVRRREEAVNVKERAIEAGFKAIENGEITGAGYTRENRKGFIYGPDTTKERQMQIWNSIQPAFEVVWKAAYSMYLAVFQAQEKAAENAAEAIRGEIKAVKLMISKMTDFTRTAEQRADLQASGLEPAFERMKQAAAKDPEGYSITDQREWLKNSGRGR